MSIGVYFRGKPAIDAERFRSIFRAAMAATGSSNRADRWDCFLEAHTCNMFMWGEESLDCHIYFDRVTLAQEPPPGFESTPIGRSLHQGDVTTMFVEASPVPGFTDLEYRRVALAVADILTPDSLAIFDWIGNRIAKVTPETATLLRSSNPRCAFDAATVLGPPRNVTGR